MSHACPICGQPIEPGEITWPVGEKDGACQMCWEADCDALWWLAMTEMGAL